MPEHLSRIEHIVGFLGRLVLAFFICFVGFIVVTVGYQTLTSISFEGSFNIVALLLFYVAIMVVVILSYKVLTSGNSI
ncbi:MAG: hypothetical protein R6U44_04960 [Archaeoglobaceae archaeon]